VVHGDNDRVLALGEQLAESNFFSFHETSLK
jgi:hypothetical protein